jgi:hypothetical protein
MDPFTTVRFEFTQEDFIGFNLYHHQHSSATRRLKVQFVLLFLAAGLAGLVFKLIERESPDSLWVVPIACVGGALIYPWTFRWSLRRNVNAMLAEGRNKGLLGQKEITLTPAEIRSTGAMGAVTAAWPAVERIVVDGDVLYIYISSLSAVVVPRRAFVQDSDFQAFTETAWKHLAEAAGRAK